MGDDPRKNLKWLERELLAEENMLFDTPSDPSVSYHGDEILRKSADRLCRENAAESNSRRKTSQKTEAVFVKSRAQLRREAKQRKRAAKNEKVNRNLKGLVLLALLECIGILLIIGWWIQ